MLARGATPMHQGSGLDLKVNNYCKKPPCTKKPNSRFFVIVSSLGDSVVLYFPVWDVTDC